MADPGQAVEVHGNVAVNGHVTGRDSEALLAQIDQTREDLARTIDTLAERVSPASNIRALRDKAVGELSRPQVKMAAAAAGAVVVGLVVWRIWARRRH